MKRVWRVIAIVFLVVTSFAGIANGINELGDMTTGLQRSVQFGDAAWGIFGLLTAIGMWRRRSWTLRVSFAWAAALVYTATVASFAFSDPTFSQQGTVIGTASTFVATGGIAALIVWAVRVATRPEVPAEADVAAK